MVIDRNETRLCTLGQLKATGEVEFERVGGDEDATGTSSAAQGLSYPQLKRTDKGGVLRYLSRTTRIRGNS